VQESSSELFGVAADNSKETGERTRGEYSMGFVEEGVMGTADCFGVMKLSISL